MAHRNRWFPVLKNGGFFHGYVSHNQMVIYECHNYTLWDGTVNELDCNFWGFMPWVSSRVLGTRVNWSIVWTCMDGLAVAGWNSPRLIQLGIRKSHENPMKIHVKYTEPSSYTRTWSFICISALFLDGWWRSTSEIQPKSTGKWVFTRFFWSERILAEWKWPVFFGNALWMFVIILYVCEVSMVSPCKPWEQDVLYLIDWIWFLIPDLLFFCWLVVWNIFYFSIYWE